MKVQVTDGGPSVMVFLPDMSFNNPLVPGLALKQAIAEQGKWLAYVGTKPIFHDNATTGWYAKWQFTHPKRHCILDVWECSA